MHRHWKQFTILLCASGCHFLAEPDDIPSSQPLADSGSAPSEEPSEEEIPPDPEDPDEDYIVTRGSADCAAAETIQAPASLAITASPTARYLRLLIPPGRATGVSRTFAWGSEELQLNIDALGDISLVCGDCEAFRQDGCADPRIPPNYFIEGLDFYMTGEALIANPSTMPREVVLRLPQATGFLQLEDFPLAPPDDNCPGGMRDAAEGVAYPPIPAGCKRRLQIDPNAYISTFGIGTPGFSDELANLTDNPRTVELDDGGPFAWRSRALPPASRCATAPRLSSGESERIRVDQAPALSNELCFDVDGDLTARGTGYLEVVVPSGSRANLSVVTAMVADGGGHPQVLVADDCDPARACESRHYGAWEAGGFTITIDNPTDTTMTRKIAVMQQGIGYDYNTAEVALDVSRR